MLIEMKVASLTVDPFTDMPSVMLRDAEGNTLPIWIGVAEASAITAELESIRLDRPMTHDLMNTILGACAIAVDRVEIHDLKNSTFFATIFLKRPDGAPLAIDARPSDAIALALRARAPIFVAKKIIEKAASRWSQRPAKKGATSVSTPSPEVLSGLSPGHFGKWKM